ncbi:methionine synthase / sulfite reductase-like protein [Euroglyphus maynei]|uniref:Methionine synthase / sulfite reductase-like protein n=1 Tax=Euroglyphus maynei TaxID=6958 RepID=A0A1Y3B9H4_EURMA|nr:methionine synthase / sulfite reductase-like protein [Euroglyphus maynei]
MSISSTNHIDKSEENSPLKQSTSGEHCNNHIEQIREEKLENEAESPETIKHVDELIRLHGEELTDLIINHNAIIYICGNWKLITTNIKQAFNEILTKYHFNIRNEQQQPQQPQTSEAMKYLKQLQQNGRFVQDIWT